MGWTHTKPPFGVPVKLFNHYGQVREGVSDGVSMHLTDCTHPMQNCFYPVANVIAWKLETSHRI
jgi:hypothetical protein